MSETKSIAAVGGSFRFPFFKICFSANSCSIRLCGDVQFQFRLQLLSIGAFEMDCGHPGLSMGQIGKRVSAESGEDDALMLDRLGIIERWLSKGRGLTTLDTNDPGEAVGDRKLQLISG